MKYFKNGGFYDKDIHSAVVGNWEEFISGAVEVTDEQWQRLLKEQSKGKIIQVDPFGNLSAVNQKPLSLDKLKERAINQLWMNYKNHQQKYVDAEDLTLASICAAQGSDKGKAVLMWVMNLWGQYYAVKDAVTAAETGEALNVIDLIAKGEPPYTIRELNEEMFKTLQEVGK